MVEVWETPTLKPTQVLYDRLKINKINSSGPFFHPITGATADTYGAAAADPRLRVPKKGWEEDTSTFSRFLQQMKHMLKHIMKHLSIWKNPEPLFLQS